MTIKYDLEKSNFKIKLLKYSSKDFLLKKNASIFHDKSKYAFFTEEG